MNGKSKPGFLKWHTFQIHSKFMPLPKKFILLNISSLNVAVIKKNRVFLAQSADSNAVPRCAFTKRCSENMKQIYRRRSTPKCATLLK